MPNQNLSAVAQELVKAYQKRPETGSGEVIEVNEAVSSIAFVYERLRHVIDYKEDHLFRLNAIERYLNRIIYFKNYRENLAELLIRELIRSRYLKNKQIPASQIQVVHQIVHKYWQILQGEEGKKERIGDWLISLAACEIERQLVPQVRQEALTRAFYELLKPNVEAPRVQLFLAAYRALFKPAAANLRLHLLKGYLPDWSNPKPETTSYFEDHLEEIKDEIERCLNEPAGERLTRFCRHYTASLLILNDVLSQAVEQGETLDEAKLEDMVTETCMGRYAQIRASLRRKAVRSIIYLFITKMIFALLLEIPMEIYLNGSIKQLPIVINSLFPPFLMFAFVLTVPRPGEENTVKILARIKEILFRGSLPMKRFVYTNEVRRAGLREKVFRYFFSLTFLISFGVIVWGLTKIGFNAVSILVFLFFLTLVSFFAYKVSQNAKDLIVEEQEGRFALITDLFMVPILKTGKRFSSELSKINIFNFILDFVIEAPFKTILEIIEEWLGFLREKKEEIISS
jgi:hypothetical protein